MQIIFCVFLSLLHSGVWDNHKIWNYGPECYVPLETLCPEQFDIQNQCLVSFIRTESICTTWTMMFFVNLKYTSPAHVIWIPS
jgi:hypothetical protein